MLGGKKKPTATPRQIRVATTKGMVVAPEKVERRRKVPAARREAAVAKGRAAVTVREGPREEAGDHEGKGGYGEEEARNARRKAGHPFKEEREEELAPGEGGHDEKSSHVRKGEVPV